MEENICFYSNVSGRDGKRMDWWCLQLQPTDSMIGLGVSAEGHGEIKNHFIWGLNLWEDSSTITEKEKIWGTIWALFCIHLTFHYSNIILCAFIHFIFYKYSIQLAVYYWEMSTHQVLAWLKNCPFLASKIIV